MPIGTERLPLVAGAVLAVAALIGCSDSQTPTSGDGPAPAGLVFQDGFESGNLDAWYADGPDVDAGKYSVTSDAAHVRSGSHALEIKLNPTTASDYGELFIELVDMTQQGYDEIYVSMDVMWSQDFQNRRGDNCQMHFATIGGGRRNDHSSMDGQAGVVPDGRNFFLTNVQPDETCTAPYDLLPWAFYTYHMDQRGNWGDLISQDPPRVYPSEEPTWQQIVVGVRLNTYGPPTLADGWQKLWIDGEQKIDQQGLRWRSDPTSLDRLLELNRFMFWAYMEDPPASLGTQYIWVDNVTIQTERPAGLSP